MNNVTTFTHKSQPVRIVEKDGKKYFVIRDICNIVGYSNPNRQLAIHTENVPLYDRINTPGGLQVVRLVPREDVEKLLNPNHGLKSIYLRRWLFTKVYPKIFPELMDEARRVLTCVLVDFNVSINKVMPVEKVKAKATRHENR